VSPRGRKAPPLRWVHLFTSTIRELYITDAIDLLAAPKGAHYRFRYEAKYLDEELRQLWDGKPGISGFPIAVHFSLQHPAEFHKAVFLPLRRGEVVATVVEGDTYVIYFRLGDYTALEDDPDWPAKQRATSVQKYTDGLKTLLVEKQPDSAIHASLGDSPEHLFAPVMDPGLAFASIVRFLTPTLYQNPRTYWRVARITKNTSGEPLTLSEEGQVTLSAGQDYTVHLAHYQYQALAQAVDVSVRVPPGLTVVGRDLITLSSRYDLIPVRVYPPFRDDVVSGEIAIKTEPPASGPSVQIPVLVTPTRAHSASGPALGVAGALALALPAVLASSHYLPLRVGLAAAGAALAGLGLWWRRQKGLTG
jgi:hypothetical protein